MTRRMALAVALAFTTMVTFSVVVFGAQHGVFSDPKTPARQAAAQPPADTPVPAATATATAVPPIVITRYVYVDDPSPVSATATRPSVAAQPPTASPTTVPPAAAPRPTRASSEHDDNEHEEGGD